MSDNDKLDAAVLEERRRIVAWLREDGPTGAAWGRNLSKMVKNELADAIERGDHLEQGKAK